MCGEVMMWRKVARMAVAVVSEPATLFCRSKFALRVLVFE